MMPTATEARTLALAGRSVLVTGAGTGIGRGIAIACAEAGADVALHYFDEADGAATAATAIRALGRQAVTIRGDFRNLADVERVADEALRQLGSIDVLVNNAGITASAPCGEVTPEFFDTVFAVNVRAGYFLTTRLAPVLARRGGGSVINLASLHAFFGVREHSVYAATKGAIVALTAQLAVELAPIGIRVNAIAPGTCVGENHRATQPDADFIEAAKSLPAGYYCEPVEVGRLAVFLASSDGRYFVGQTLRFDGGYSALLPLGPDFRTPLGQRWGRRYLEAAS